MVVAVYRFQSLVRHAQVAGDLRQVDSRLHEPGRRGVPQDVRAILTWVLASFRTVSQDRFTLPLMGWPS
jgi:hypothetical protein